MFKEIKAELKLDDVEEGNLVQTGVEENSESTGREIVLIPFVVGVATEVVADWLIQHIQNKRDKH